MDFSIEFKTGKFDFSAEEENPINPIYGQSLIQWLRREASGKVEIPEPDYEDWGWYCHVESGERVYLLGASSDDGETWIIQLEKLRSFKEKIFGKEKLSPNDELWNFLLNLIQAEPEFAEVSVG